MPMTYRWVATTTKTLTRSRGLWAVMQALLTPEEFRGFLKGNMIKYAMRQGKKDSPDAGKYWHYKTKLDEITAGEPWI